MKKKDKNSKKKADETDILKSQLARALADYHNLQKRIEKQQELLENTSNLRIISKMLSVLDMLIEVQGHVDDPGLAITITEFTKVLNEEGVEKIDVKKGDDFDENYQDVVEKINTKDKDKKGKVADVVSIGWVKGEIIIRPVSVKVYG